MRAAAEDMAAAVSSYAGANSPVPHNYMRHAVLEHSGESRNPSGTRRERYLDIQSKILHERRGISRTSLDHGPLESELPVDYVNSVKKAIQRYDSAVGINVNLPVTAGNPPLVSGQPQRGAVTAAGEQVEDGDSEDSDSSSDTWQEDVHWMDGDEDRTLWHEGGNTTDRTSLSSSDWGDDVCEFDRQESRRVRQMFEEIETMLFENPESLQQAQVQQSAPRLQHQTSQGSQSSHYHHHHHPHQPAGAVALKRECGEWTGRFPHLRLLGSQVVAPQDLGYSWYPMEEGTPRPATGSILVDVNDSENPATDSLSLAGRRLIPRSNLEELSHLTEEVFDQDGVVEDMLAVDFRLTEEETPAARQGRRQQHRHHGFPPLTPNAALKDTLTSTMFDHLWNEVVSWMRPLVRESLRRSNLPVVDDDLPDSLPVEPPGAAVARLHGLMRAAPVPAATSTGDDLSGLLHISIKALQLRERSSLQDIPELPTPIPSEHPGRPQSSTTATAILSGAMTRATSARRGRGRLAPLDRPKTPNLEEEALAAVAAATVAAPSGFGLRGRSINPAMERSLVSPGQLVRSGTLPPLMPAAERKYSRVGSGRPLAAALLQLDRPNTTQSFARAETPGFRRSSTPLSLSRMGGVLLNMSVQGVGAGNLSSNLVAAEDEQQQQRPPTTNWGSYPPSNPVNNPYRRGKQLSSIVR